MATFIELHQGQRLPLINLDAVPVIQPKDDVKKGSRVLFPDGNEVEYDELVENITPEV